MVGYHTEYPEYNFAIYKGYSTPDIFVSSRDTGHVRSIGARFGRGRSPVPPEVYGHHESVVSGSM